MPRLFLQQLRELEASLISPNEYGDWLNQRSGDFTTFPSIDGRQGSGIFTLSSAGMKTNRDAWVYGDSEKGVLDDVSHLIECHYNSL